MGGSFGYTGRVLNMEVEAYMFGIPSSFDSGYSAKHQGFYWQYLEATIDTHKGSVGLANITKAYYNQMPVRTRRGRLSPLAVGGRTI